MSEENRKNVLDEEDARTEETEEEAVPEEEKKKDVGELLREECRGTLTLMQPIRAHSQDITEIKFDLCGLTGTEMMDALDGAGGINMTTITNKQAMALFAASAEKCAPTVKEDGRIIRLYDAKDITSRMGAADSVVAAQVAKLFYHASSQAGAKNISKES